MKRQYPLILIYTLLLMLAFPLFSQKTFDALPTYPEADLWTRYTKDKTTFSLWSPGASSVVVHFYAAGNGGAAIKTISLEEEKPGLWRTTVAGDFAGTYYTYQVMHGNKLLDETPGIYATAVGVNGQRAMVLDPRSTDPAGWETDRGPALEHPNKAVIYELHVRDLTSHPNSGSSHPGKFIGLVEKGTTGPGGVKTGLDHIVELGITHVHLLPSFDHYSIDESRLDVPQFNWGYDPQNYNVPEGSYSTDPFNAEVRIREFKEMVKGFHDAGIGVILDVVYNHTGRTEESNFNRELPGYYYRFNEDGSWSDAAACGNETASERTMMRKYMIESVRYWAEEYHIDGFRFDLMGIHDIETMNLIADTLNSINPDIFVYGEGWTAGGSPLPEERRALKKHVMQMPQITAFSDDIRDGLKGSVFIEESTGFVSGAEQTEASVRFGVVGSVRHPQVDYAAVNYSDAPWANDPWQAISYVSCHDNHTLFDKLTISRPGVSVAHRIAMHKLANAIVMTSQGVPFLHAGVEMMRTKGGEENSYNKPDAVNRIDWNWKKGYASIFDYYRNLVSMRKKHPAFFMDSGEKVRDHLRFLETPGSVVAYTIDGAAANDVWTEVLVIYNALTEPFKMPVEGTWHLAVSGDEFSEKGIGKFSGEVSVPPVSMLVAFRK